MLLFSSSLISSYTLLCILISLSIFVVWLCGSMQDDFLNIKKLAAGLLARVIGHELANQL
jgi:hypothetical protein